MVEQCPFVLVCTTDQRDKLINECDGKNLKLVLMRGFHCGMRQREIIEAVPSWFNMEQRQATMRSGTS